MINLTSTNPIDRPLISESVKKAVSDAFLIVPDGKTNAIIGIYDFESKEARLHFAWKANDTWKVGAQIGWALNSKPTGYVGVEAAW